MIRGGVQRAHDAVDSFVAVVDELAESSLIPLSDDEYVESMLRIETAMRKLAYFGHRLVMGASDRGLPRVPGRSALHKYLVETLNLSKAEAWRRIQATENLVPFLGASGARHEPLLPHTAEAQAEGAISPDHVRTIIATMNRVPASVAAVDRELAEQELANHAREVTPHGMRKLGEAILAHLDPDGKLTNDVDRQRRRAITLTSQGVDGMSEGTMTLTPALRALMDVMLAKWARPGMCNPADPESPSATAGPVDPEAVKAAAARDTRTAAQRNHDAFEAFLRAGGPENLGVHRGIPVQVVLTMSVQDVEQAAGFATTATGGSVPLGEALRMAERAHPVLMIFDHRRSMPLHLGVGPRLGNRWQRLARTAIERGCTRPGCDAPATMCQMHHVLGYAQRGPTDIENLTLACDRCHGLITGTEAGWETQVLGEDSEFPGRVAWRAPAHIDPARRWRVNRAHHGEARYVARRRAPHSGQ
ncbi:DUF222 domain-containing protein [Nocardia sp. NPDC050406]|uniref:HNH endonuclease signature motif containing protein n=1 Tax=Nocardia sp. NPDC050406 TaxID=3364318 RepID=UPI0037BCCF06